MMEQPSNLELMAELTIIRKQMDRLVRNLPVLAAATADVDLKRAEAEKDRRRRESAQRAAAGWQPRGSNRGNNEESDC